MPTEVMTRNAPLMPTEMGISSWGAVPWKTEMSCEKLLAVRIWQLERKAENIGNEVQCSDNTMPDSGTSNSLINYLG